MEGDEVQKQENSDKVHKQGACSNITQLALDTLFTIIPT